MLTFGGGRLFLVAGATDMRKSFNGLAGVVREKLEADPMSRQLFFFCNRDRNRLKVLVAHESGMWVLSKRLDRGTFARIARKRSSAATACATALPVGGIGEVGDAPADGSEGIDGGALVGEAAELHCLEARASGGKPPFRAPAWR